MEGYNLQEEFGWLLDGIEKYISETPIEHYGVLGMKWGVRKDRKQPERELKGLGPDKIVRKTASGETLTLTRRPPNAIHRRMAAISKTYREEFRNTAYLVITDSGGKKVGEASVAKEDDELYLMWLGIKKSERGQGYATAAVKAAEEFGKEEGFKRMKLEVPGNAPDARHIYENMGFKFIGEVDGGRKDPVWGGLSEMEYIFEDQTVKHQELDDILEHYGVLGMKWGVRRSQAELNRAAGRAEKKAKRKAAKAPSEDAVRAKDIRKKVQKGGVKALSNEELKELNQRLNLEQQYKNLTNVKMSKEDKKLIGEIISSASDLYVSSTRINPRTNQVGMALEDRNR